MLLKYFYDKRLSQASYLIGCTETGQAMIIDPIRNITPYLNAANEHELRITHVTETHIHADFVSGVRDLVTATQATAYLSDMGSDEWKYQYAEAIGATPVHDGDKWMVGTVKVEAIHTPGHTPEHLAYMITDTTMADRPIGIFTGDFLFVGDVGRPDLLETVAGVTGSKEIGARQQYQSVQRIKTLPDYLQIWPGHGAGSACGKALGAIPSTTLGYEKLFNPAFQIEDEDQFVAWLLDGQPEAPRYFAQMKQVNKRGPVPLNAVATPQLLKRADLEKALEAHQLVIDTRRAGTFIKEHIAGTISIPASSNSFSTYVGWFVDYDAPLYLIVESFAQVDPIFEALHDIGIDTIGGYVTDQVFATFQTTSMPTVTAAEIAKWLPQKPITIIDVRSASEYDELHIPEARNIPLGLLPQHFAELPTDGMLVMQCASGYRSLVAASILRKHGFTNAVTLDDTMAHWSALLAADRASS